ncbi:Vps62-related protein [Rugamonas sp. CCM 8940]|uniref:Vps62-related protein n=1 Tax=Rugamonas sp. CCM 8940 TaxID=2765359 RepID=UPI0018F4D38B|nr:Vps62-related protein [Rugamonas sp. CCM 8940]MBJ7310028.1 Vps62-related protein [Rugamonas sp. CCM 8940]
MSNATQTVNMINLAYYSGAQDGWNTGGVNGGENGSFVNPDGNLPYGFLQFGSMAITDSIPASSFLVAAVDGVNVVPSTGWTQVWSTEGVTGGENGYLFVPTAPAGYVALGATFTNNGTPTFHVACVLEQFAVPGTAVEIWSTAGISGGADLMLGIAVLDPSNFTPTPGGTTMIPIPTGAFLTLNGGTANPAANMLQQCVGQ